MKKLLSILSISGLVFILLFSSCSSTDSSFKASLDNAGKEIGIDVPWPHSLPEGFELDSVSVDGTSVVELSAVNKSNQTITTVIDWRPSGIIPYKRFPEYQTVNINGILGQIIPGDTTTIVWNWYAEKYKPGLILMKILAPKDIPVADLTSVAESVNWDK